jgi:hypothetical protein
VEKDKLSIFCADVGSVSGERFGWWGSPELDGTEEDFKSMPTFADSLAADLRQGVPVALGFECPLFIPARDAPEDLLTAIQGNPGEGDRPFSSGAGATALVAGLAQALWVFRQLRQRLAHKPRVTFNWQEFKSCGGLFVWEAFVTRRAGDHGHVVEGVTNTHVEDAKSAVNAFQRALPDPTKSNIMDEPRVFSLAAAALLRAGWGIHPALLAEPCLVIAPDAAPRDEPVSSR